MDGLRHLGYSTPNWGLGWMTASLWIWCKREWFLPILPGQFFHFSQQKPSSSLPQSFHKTTHTLSTAAGPVWLRLCLNLSTWPPYLEASSSPRPRSAPFTAGECPWLVCPALAPIWLRLTARPPPWSVAPGAPGRGSPAWRGPTTPQSRAPGNAVQHQQRRRSLHTLAPGPWDRASLRSPSPTDALCHIEKWGGSRGPHIHIPLRLKGRALFLTPHPTLNNCPRWKVLEPGYGEPIYRVTLRLTTKSSGTAGAIPTGHGHWGAAKESPKAARHSSSSDRAGWGGEGGPPPEVPRPSAASAAPSILWEGHPAHIALFSRSHCPTALRTALRYHHSNAELFSGAKIQLFCQDFTKIKQANHYWAFSSLLTAQQYSHNLLAV